MKEILIAMLTLPFCLCAIEVDEEYFHEVIQEEISSSAMKRYRMQIDNGDDEVTCYQCWFESGYQKGLLVAEEAFLNSAK